MLFLPLIIRLHRHIIVIRVLFDVGWHGLKMNRRLSPRILLLLKYSFLLVVVCGMCLAFFPALRLKQDMLPEVLDVGVENFTQPYTEAKYTQEQLKNDPYTCFQQPRSDLPATESKSSIISESSFFKSQAFYKSYLEFNSLLKSFSIEVVTIEPSLLYCTLKDSVKGLLRKRRFNITEFMGSPDVLTFGIREGDAYRLQQDAISSKFAKAGFKSYASFTNLTDWMQKADSMLWFQNPPAHLFYIRMTYTFHLVVFYERRNYYWHAAIDIHGRNKLPMRKDWHFANDNGAYEKFSFVPLQFEALGRVHLPSSPHYFLFQMATSRFLECDPSRAANLTSDLPKTHSLLSVEQFNLRTFIAVHQLKTVFQPLLLNWWIWSGTMLGWYRQCDVIPYTTDADFGAWAGEVEDLDALIDQFRSNPYVSIKARMGLLGEALEFQLDCKGLRVDVFFMYRVENGSWCSGHVPREGIYFRYYYPHFTLCSAELLGAKVQVPCETEDVIVNEYGRDWRTPRSAWSYTSSIKNRGPNIFWGRKHRKDAYKYY